MPGQTRPLRSFNGVKSDRASCGSIFLVEGIEAVAVTYRRFEDGSWGGEAKGVRFFIDDDGGQPNVSQQALADQIVRELGTVQAQAAEYLRRFVDRAKVCGNCTEDWWLEEIEMRGLSTARSTQFRSIFTILGDDGGYWYVQFSRRDQDIQPHAFGRQQT